MSFTLTLDTTAPQIALGAVTGDTAGELLRVGYTIDEPAVVAVELVLRDGRRLPMTDTGLTFEVALPPDTPNGWSGISVDVLDDVGNAATRGLAVHLTGTIIEPQPEDSPTPGWPVARPRRPRPAPAARTIRSRVVVAADGATVVTTLGRKRAIGVATSRAHVSAAASRRFTWTAVPRATVTAGAPHSRSQHTLVSRASIGRRDGPDAEAILLGLI